jgi:hypothetical protein
VSTRQVILAAIVLGLVCAGVVWYLERFELERIDRMVSEFRAELDRLPTFNRESEQP